MLKRASLKYQKCWPLESGLLCVLDKIAMFNLCCDMLKVCSLGPFPVTDLGFCQMIHNIEQEIGRLDIS